jgi:hypothetical protein
VALDLSVAIAEVEIALNAASGADLEPWAVEDLWDWMDEGAKRLARLCGVFVDRDTSNAIVTGTAAYPLPAGHLSTIHASAGTLALYPANVQELEALDSNWVDTSGPTDTYLMDTAGVTEVQLYPRPDVSVTGNVALIFAHFPAKITSGATTLSAPPVVQDYLKWHAIAEARRRQSDYAMPDVAEALDKWTGMLEEIFTGFFGTAEP